MKLILPLFAIILMFSSVQAQSAAELPSEKNKNSHGSFERIPNTFIIQEISSDPYGDQLKLKHGKKDAIIKDYIKANDVEFISEEKYLSLSAEERKMVNKNPKLIVSSNPHQYIKENPGIVDK